MGLILAGAAARAQDVNVELPVIGAPHANGISFQEAVTSIARDVHELQITIVRNMLILSKWAYCAPCALQYAHYMHYLSNPPRSC